ncbi:MAG: hypothetical protein HOV83_02430 [Catenulispora sp.]|nr:hypothetical protein [Catenulispora sp.]
MSADTVLAEADEAAPFPRRPAPSADDPGWLARQLRRDLFGVRLGVLLLLFPMFVVTMWMQVHDRHEWNHPPDSRYYLPMISMDMGHPIGESVRIEQELSPHWTLAPWYFADNDPTWQMVRTRVMYPVLSVPFVWIWGLSVGTMVLPIVGDVLFLWVTARILQRLYGPAVALTVAGMFSFVQPIWGFSWAGTDTLAMGMAAVIVANLPIERRIGRANLVWLGAFTLFIAMTRQVGVLAPAMAGAGWLWALVGERSWRNRWTGAFAVTAAVTGVAQVVMMTVAKTDTAGVIGRGESTYWGVFRQFVHYLKVVTEQATTYMWHSDRILYALLIAAGLTVVVRFASDAAAVFVGAAGATYLITAGIGFSSLMRYEMMMVPAAAVAAGSLVSMVLGDRPPSRLEAPEPVTRAPSAMFATLAGTRAGRFAGLHLPRPDRWKPQLILNSAVLVAVVVVTLQGSWPSAAKAPASPSFAAAQGGSGYAVTPLAKPGAEVTLRAAFTQAALAANNASSLQGAFDWVHEVRYRPTAPDQPGWPARDRDGTAIMHANALGEDINGQKAFGNGITLGQTVVPDTVQIVERQVSEYGEDVVFTVKDKAGTVHRGTATTLYPIWDPKATGVITALIFDPS